MNYKVLYRKYRPKNFEELVGQNNIKELLKNAVINNKLAHAYIFTGPRGTGKTSTAKLFAKVINCDSSESGIPCEICPQCLSYNESSDIIEIDAASNNGVDEIRELRDNVKILPASSKYKVYIIDEVHMLSTSAWNAFLKTLEEPPHHVIFILATTEIHKVPITVLSRCQRFDFQRISDKDTFKLIETICKKEKIEITSDALTEVVNLSDGGLRDALGIIDQISKLEQSINLETLKQTYGIVGNQDIDELLEYLTNGQVSEIITKIDILKQSGVSGTQFLNKLLNNLLNRMIESKKGTPCGIKNIDEIIMDLEECYSKSNHYLLIKVILLRNCQSIPLESPLSSIIDEKQAERDVDSKNDSQLQKSIAEEMSDNSSNSGYNLEIVNIRINNSFVEASLDLKNQFKEKWQKFIKKTTQNNEFKYISIIGDLEVEVVSPTNVLFSTSSYSNSVLFNSLANEIAEKFNKESGFSTKMICLDTETWKRERDIYIKNKNKKGYNLLSEPETILETPTINAAEILFGDGIVEIN